MRSVWSLLQNSSIRRYVTMEKASLRGCHTRLLAGAENVTHSTFSFKFGGVLDVQQYLACNVLLRQM